MRIIIGVDGGGTKTEFVRCDETGRVLRHYLLPASNPFDIGYTAAYSVLRKGIRALIEGTDGRIDGMFVGLSGGTSGNYQARIHGALSADFPLATFQNGSDAANAISMGLGEDDGVILIAGTGSVSFAKEGAQLRRVGGWGYLFDGAGGGYDLGRGAIAAVLSAADGTGEKTMLTALITKQLGGDVAEMLDRIYQGGKRFIAGFAPLVFTAAAQNDIIAKDIINESVVHWTRLIRAAAASMQTPVKTALIGSLFKQNELVVRPLCEILGNRYEVTVPQTPPVFGAVRKALRLAGLWSSADTEAYFVRSLKEVEAVELSAED